MNLKTSLHTCFMQKYASTSGRASRSEYWWFSLVFNIIYLILFLTLTYFIEPIDPQKPIYWQSLCLLLIPFVIFFIPFASVSIRRFHDIGMAGWHFWFVLIALHMPMSVKLRGFIIFIYFAKKDHLIQIAMVKIHLLKWTIKIYLSDFPGLIAPVMAQSK